MRRPSTTLQPLGSLKSPVVSLSLEMPDHCSTQGPVGGYQSRRGMEGATGSGKKEGALIPTAGGICQNLIGALAALGSLPWCSRRGKQSA